MRLLQSALLCCVSLWKLPAHTCFHSQLCTLVTQSFGNRKGLSCTSDVLVSDRWVAGILHWRVTPRALQRQELYCMVTVL